MSVFSRRSDAVKEWDELQPAWQAALALAWEAYRAEAVPVGAVLVDGSGAMLARARDHVYDAGGAVSGMLGHAPMAALAGLDPVRRYESLTLFTTIEPCAMCIGACGVAALGSVTYLASDPYAGAGSFVPTNEQARRHTPAVRGPVGGAAGRLAALVHLEPFLRLNPEGAVASAYLRHQPETHEAADRLREAGTLEKAARKRATVADLFEDLWESVAVP